MDTLDIVFRQSRLHVASVTRIFSAAKELPHLQQAVGLLTFANVFWDGAPIETLATAP